MENNALNIILSQLRVSGSIVLSQAHRIPWAIKVPHGNALRGYLGVNDNVNVVPFHIAHRGDFELQTEGENPITVKENQMVMCAHGRGHTIRSGQTNQIHSFEEVISAGSFSDDNDSESTDVVCGVFMLRNTALSPLVSALPGLVIVDVQGSNSSSTMSQLHDILRIEITQARNASAYMLERVLEMLYSESVRVYSEQESSGMPSWLAAINDRRIGAALNFIHSNLDQSLDVELLAKQVALSPSRFASSFRDIIGISPIAYITTQRQALASQLLIETNLPIQEIALECGYQSIPSFNKAFLKQFDATPTAWRKRQMLPLKQSQ